MRNRFVLFFVLFFLFILSSCKESTTEDLNSALPDEISTKNYFDSVLQTTDINGAATAGSSTTEEELGEEETTAASKETNFAAPECGDMICQYYETYSSCAKDCQKLEETTLGHYPEFLEDVLLVVGDDASSTDVITATLISSYLMAKDIKTKTVLASEVTDFYTNDLILIGSPCDNQAIAELLQYTAETCRDIIKNQNNAVIKLLVYNTNEIIIITGHDAGDTKAATTMLIDEKYNLNGAEEWVNLVSTGEINVYYSRN